MTEKHAVWLCAVVFALCFIGVLVFSSAAIKTLPEKQEQQDIFFLCSYEKIADNYFLLVYSKNGETYYPHFTNIRQVHSFIAHLGSLGALIKNGYEIKGEENDESM